jgi:hypothetical protein
MIAPAHRIEKKVWEPWEVRELIAVFVPHMNPPSVFETSEEQLQVMARDATGERTHTSSVPPGVIGGEFAIAWATPLKICATRVTSRM